MGGDDMIASPLTLAVIAVLWAVLTVYLWRSRRWLAFYVTGAFGFVLVALSVMRTFGADVAVEAWQAHQVVVLARLIGINLGVMGGSGLAIPGRSGWAVFDIGIECSALLETFAFVALAGFYPAFTSRRKAATVLVGAAATWVINLLRILLIVGIIASLGTDWVYAAHAVFGRVFFFAATIAVYWYLITRPTIRIVSVGLAGDSDG
jgi:exosortase family protein XrtG